MTPASSKKGITLLELLIAGTLLGLLTTMVAKTVVMAFTNEREVSKKTTEFRRAVNNLERLGRELRMCEKFYSPDATTAAFQSGTPYTPEVGVNPPLVFRRYDSGLDQDIVVAYTLDTSRDELSRSLYEPTFDPSNASSQVIKETRVVSTETEEFSVSYIDPTETFGNQLLKVRFSIKGVELSPEMEVQVKKL